MTTEQKIREAFDTAYPAHSRNSNNFLVFKAGYLSRVKELSAIKQSEPVAWRFSKGSITKLDSWPHGGNWKPLFETPQPDRTAKLEAALREALSSLNKLRETQNETK